MSKKKNYGYNRISTTLKIDKGKKKALKHVK